MIKKRKLKHHRRGDRRKTPDRRNGYDRRTNTGQDPVDNNVIFNTQEACLYIKISRPTYFKYITTGKIKAQKIGRGWRVFKDELDRFIRGEWKTGNVKWCLLMDAASRFWNQPYLALESAAAMFTILSGLNYGRTDWQVYPSVVFASWWRLPWWSWFLSELP